MLSAWLRSVSLRAVLFASLLSAVACGRIGYDVDDRDGGVTIDGPLPTDMRIEVDAADDAEPADLGSDATPDADADAGVDAGVDMGPVPAVLVTPTTGLVTDETGDRASFTIVLASMPTLDVVIELSVDDDTEGSVEPARVTFTPSNWNAPQTVDAIGADDELADGDVLYNVVTSVTARADPAYDALAVDDVAITNADNDTAGFELSRTSGLITGERGESDFFSIALRAQPSADVTIALASDSLDEASVSPDSVTFTTDNWASPQAVEVIGVDDDVADGTQTFTIETAPATSTDLAFSGLDADDVSGSNLDDDIPAVYVSDVTGLVTTESGGTAMFTVVLGSQPTADVQIPVVSLDTSEGTVSTSMLTFTATSWSTPQAVTVTGANDDLVDGNQLFTVTLEPASSADPAYDAIAVASVVLTNTDDDTAAFIVTPDENLVTTEGGGTATFTITLTAQPIASVIFSISSSDLTEATVSPTTVVIAPGTWNMPRTVTVTGVNDALSDGDQPYTITVDLSASGDGDYAPLPSVDVSGVNVDDETPGINVTPTSGLTTTEGLAATTFSVRLNSIPSGNVVVTFVSDDLTEGTVSPANVTITPGTWSTPRTITVTGVNDNVDDGDIVYHIITDASTSVDGVYAAINPSDVTLVNTDNDTAGVTVTPTSGLVTTEAGAAATFSVVLTSQPTNTVNIALSSSDLTEGTVSPATLAFTTGDWNVPRTVTVTGVNDALIDGDIPFSIVTGAATSADATYNGFAVDDVSVTNQDNDVGGVVITPTSGLVTTEAGGSASFTAVLGTAPTADVTLSLSSSDATEGSVAPASITFTTANWNIPQTVTATGVDDVAADGTVAYSIITSTTSSTDGAFNALPVADVSVSNTDNDTAGATVTPTVGISTTESGGTASFTVVLAAQPSANVTISVASNDLTEGTVSAASLTFTSFNWNVAQTITVTGVDDGLADGTISYQVILGAMSSADLAFNGVAVTDVSLTNTDNDSANVLVAPTAGLTTTEAGGTASFFLVLSAAPSASVSVALATSDSTEGTVSPASVTFTTGNWNVSQMVTVTGVDDAAVDGNIAYTIVTGAASSTDPIYNGRVVADVSVTNTDNDIVGITVTPTSGLVTTEALGTATFTIVLNSQPSANVVVAFASSDSTEGTVSPVSVLFTTANWSTPRTITITGVNDSIADGNVAYTIVTSAASSADPNYNLFAIADVSVTNTDNEVVGVQYFGTPVRVTDGGNSKTFTLRLTAQPSGDVTVGFTSSDLTEGTISPASLTFTTANWNTVQGITVTGVVDGIADGDQTFSIVSAPMVAAGMDAFDGYDPPDVAVTGHDVEDRRCVSCDNTYQPVATASGLGARAMSSDGRYALFRSTANFLVGDVGSGPKLYLRDRLSGLAGGVSTRVDLTSGGAPSVTLASIYDASMSPDARYVCFATYASDILPGDTNGSVDVYLRDRTMGTVERVSIRDDEAQIPLGGALCHVSDDGRYVLFGTGSNGMISSVNDTNNNPDYYLRDRMAGTTTRVTLKDTGVQGGYTQSPWMSPDGRYVTFLADTSFAAPAGSGWHVYRRDVVAGTTIAIDVNTAGTIGNNGLSTTYQEGPMSSDGRYVVFSSPATNLVAGDTNGVADIFMRDTTMSITTRVSVTDAGAQNASATTGACAISTDGRYVGFFTAGALVAEDTNAGTDAYVRDVVGGHTYLISRDRDGLPLAAGAGGTELSFSDDMSSMLVYSTSGSLIGYDVNSVEDAFVLPFAH